MPKWAYQLVRLGSAFARLNENNRSDLLVLLVPTRAFASVFLAAGMVLEDLLFRIRSTEDHFRWLCSLPPGTILENETREAVVVGVDPTSTYLLIETIKPKRARGISKYPCHSSLENWLPKNSLRPKPGSLVEGIAQHLVTDSEKWFISAESHPTVVICGERKTLFSEINAPLAPSGDQTNKGCLEELLLADAYQHQTELRRTRIESRRSRPNDLENPTEHLVIYDGGRAFINRSQDFRGTNQLLVLEYGDADLPEVLEQVESIWYERVDEDDQHAVRLPTPPLGCEMAHFQVLA